MSAPASSGGDTARRVWRIPGEKNGSFRDRELWAMNRALMPLVRATAPSQAARKAGECVDQVRAAMMNAIRLEQRAEGAEMASYIVARSMSERITWRFSAADRWRLLCDTKTMTRWEGKRSNKSSLVVREGA